MTRFLFFPVGLVVLAALLVTTSALVAGQALHQPAALTTDLTSTEHCALPCWQGVIPGETYLSSAAVILREAGYTLFSTSQGISDYQPVNQARCRVRLLSTQEERIDGEIDGRVIEIRLLGCREAMLGDTMLALRHPQVTSSGGARMSFMNGSAHVYTRGSACTEHRLTPFMRVDAVIITPQRPPHETAIPWHGFASYFAYRGWCLTRALSW